MNEHRKYVKTGYGKSGYNSMTLEIILNSVAAIVIAAPVAAFCAAIYNDFLKGWIA
jgi:hypothetical protein